MATRATTGYQTSTRGKTRIPSHRLLRGSRPATRPQRLPIATRRIRSPGTSKTNKRSRKQKLRYTANVRWAELPDQNRAQNRASRNATLITSDHKKKRQVAKSRAAGNPSRLLQGWKVLTARTGGRMLPGAPSRYLQVQWLEFLFLPTHLTCFAFAMPENGT